MSMKPKQRQRATDLTKRTVRSASDLTSKYSCTDRKVNKGWAVVWHETRKITGPNIMDFPEGVVFTLNTQTGEISY